MTNEADYEVLIVELNIIKELEIEKLKAFTNSQLVVKHVQGEYKARDSRMIKYM